MNLTELHTIIKKYYPWGLLIILFILIIIFIMSPSTPEINKNIPKSLEVVNQSKFSAKAINYNGPNFDIHYVPTYPSNGKLSAGKLYVDIKVDAFLNSPNLKKEESILLNKAKRYLSKNGINPNEKSIVYTFN
ncbi:hypothetical protein M1145_02740 [Patescibacteria group bacterium]|nr:hypothetical protein [Patescibacteria group bacterium]